MRTMANAAISALNAFGYGWQAIAHNIANINTDNFRASHVRYQELAERQGVAVGEVRQSTNPGAPLEHRPDEVNRLTQDRAEAARQDAAVRAAFDARAEQYRVASNVQLEREFADAIALEHYYAAQAALVRTYDDMMGTVLDIIV